MTTTLNFKNKIDLPEWRPLASANVLPAAATPSAVAWDLRNDITQDPYFYKLTAATTIEKYSTVSDEWSIPLTATLTAGGVAAGSGMIFVPSHGPAGLVGGTPTTTSFTLATLPNAASVGVNQLANRGDGVGYKIRIYANGTGNSGKCEEKTIVANTGGTTPVITLDSALSFLPTTTDHYEMLSGRIYILGSGTTAAGFFKAWDVATNSISGNLSVTNLSATIGVDFCAIAMDEMYVPYNQKPGDGLVVGGATYNATLNQAIQATAVAATTITGSGMPAGLTANEYKNFQVRIVEDTVNPTAVGQRRKITSHTSGATGVFTVPTWTVNPSTSAKFVIELNNDLMLWTNSAVVTYSYAAGGFAADANWSTAAISGGGVQYANPGTAMGAGCVAAMSFSIVVDVARNARHSFIYRFRGAASVTLEVFDIAANTWATIASYGGITNTTLTTGTSMAHDPATNKGMYFYLNENGTQRNKRFDMLNRNLEPWCYFRGTQGAAITGQRLMTSTFIDGATKVAQAYMLRSSGVEFYNCLIQR